MSPELYYALPVLFLATLCRATFGFGDALLAMPPLVLLLGPTVATPLVGLVASTLALLILITSWRQVAWGETWRLVLASAVAVPLGIYALKHAPERWVKGALGLVVIVYALYGLAKPAAAGDEPRLKSEHWSWPFGFLAGLLGGAYNTNGPPVVLYGALRGWKPQTFRGTLQGYFLPAGGVVLISHGVSGLWTRQVGLLYAAALPVVLAGLALGSWLHPKIPPGRFDAALNLLLIVLGGLLFVP
jgi:uncharacterized membrane protein YfcA